MRSRPKVSVKESRPSSPSTASPVTPPDSREAEVNGEGDSQGVSFDLILRLVREDILSGELKPGYRLRLAKLRERYNAGASPLREALSRLVSDNLVISHPRRGFEVAPVSLADFRSLTDLRKLLELEAVRLSLEHGDDRWEAQLVGSFHRLTVIQKNRDLDQVNLLGKWEEANREFHEILVSACGSPWLLRTRGAIYSCTERYRRICLSTVTISRNVQEEHRLIFEAAIARNYPKIEKLLSDHLERTFQKVKASGYLTEKADLH